ncbi:MAG: GNAT family N-acetyltransferase [Saprospiraceae bacterium]|nr:GNAT family N-acetyltransferase [Saprospiraceae bacterium]
MIYGTRISLKPATRKDKSKIYEWLVYSNLSKEMFGPPKYPDCPAPSWEEFDEDYLDHYFDDSKPTEGRCYIILRDDLEIGQINYNHIDPESRTTELDVWLSDKKYTGKAYGVEAIGLLCDYLFRSFGCQIFYLAPSQRNAKAIRAYQKAGFEPMQKQPDHFIPDYSDSILLQKKIK